LLASLSWKRLHIGSGMLPVTTSTSDKLLSRINIDDSERPWPSRIRGSYWILLSSAAAPTLRVNCDEMAGDILRQFANRYCYRLSRVSWALAQISCIFTFWKLRGLHELPASVRLLRTFLALSPSVRYLRLCCSFLIAVTFGRLRHWDSYGRNCRHQWKFALLLLLQLLQRLSYYWLTYINMLIAGLAQGRACMLCRRIKHGMFHWPPDSQFATLLKKPMMLIFVLVLLFDKRFWFWSFAFKFLLSSLEEN